MAKKTRKWCDSFVCGRKVSVWLGTGDEIHVLESAEGAAHGPTGTIVVDATLAPDGAEETLVHEELHLMFDYSGLRHIVREELGITAEKWSTVEEHMIRLLAPAIYNSYRASGRLKMPKRPRGAVTIELDDLLEKGRMKRCAA
jgi:hypothetical protein